MLFASNKIKLRLLDFLFNLTWICQFLDILTSLSLSLYIYIYLYIISFFFFIAWHYQNSRATITTIRLPNFKCSRLENKTDGLVSPNEINTHVSHALTNLIFGHNQREELSFNSSTTNIFFKSLNRKNDFFFFLSFANKKKFKRSWKIIL